MFPIQTLMGEFHRACLTKNEFGIQGWSSVIRVFTNFDQKGFFFWDSKTNDLSWKPLYKLPTDDWDAYRWNTAVGLEKIIFWDSRKIIDACTLQ